MMRLFVWILLGFAAIIEAGITSPSSGTVWMNGATATITWNSISGNEFSIVLTRSGTIYHHTITSTAANTGSFSWQVEIPSTDGWPTSTSSDMVYEIDFYVNGGWNNGGQLVASSQQFAIQYPGTGDPSPAPVMVTTIINPPPAIPTTITIVSPVVQGAFVTTVQTEIIVGVTTLTTVITAIYQVGTPNPTNTVTVIPTTVPPAVITVTITNTQQLNPTPTTPTLSTTFVTTFVGATTVGATSTVTTRPAIQPLYNSASAKMVDTLWLAVVVMLIGGALVLV